MIQVPRRVAFVVALATLAAIGVWAELARRRPDITDPAVLAQLRPDELRDSEIEALIHASFQESDQVTLHAGSNRDNSREVVIIERDALDDLGRSFALGRDNEKLPNYRNPGLGYVRVSFDGPYAADFQFTDDTIIWLYGHPGRSGARHRIDVRTEFAKKIADTLGLAERDENP